MPNTSSAITSSSSDICWTLSSRPAPKQKSAPAVISSTRPSVFS